MKKGGFPEFIRYNDYEYLKRIYDDILYRDILVRFRIREVLIVYDDNTAERKLEEIPPLQKQLFHTFGLINTT